MWRNYLLLIIRKYRNWQGPELVSLAGLIIAYSLLARLAGYLWERPGLCLFTTLVIALLIIAIVYLHFLALQLNRRVGEVFVRKLLGAGNRQIVGQLLLESVVLTTFLAITGLVLAPLLFSLCARALGLPATPVFSTLGQQLVFIIAMDLLIGVLAAGLPIRSFMAAIGKNFARLRHQGQPSGLL